MINIFAQFSERYEVLNNGDPSSTVGLAPLTRKHGRISRLVQRNLDTDSEDKDAISEGNSDLSKPWAAEFERYINTHESIGEGTSIVQWWGVSPNLASLRIEILILIFFASSSLIHTVILPGPHLLVTI